MENQHRQISGYRELSAEEIAQMNAIKDLAEKVGQAVSAMKTVPTFDQRWVAIGQTDLQKGFMALVRAIAQPTTF